MFPSSYSFNPGMVLDPLTMTPMLTGGGNITVNPLGVPMRPQNKVWQKMFINNIPQECTNQWLLKLLNQFGNAKNFKRAVDNRGRLMTFCHFQLQTGEQIQRIKRLFNKHLQLKISPQTQNFIKEWVSIQKDEWRKKLAGKFLFKQAPNMNQAKQYDTIQQYFQREDKYFKQKIQDTLKLVNNQVKNIARQKMRQQQRKQHPRQKQRDRKKKRLLEQLQRSFNQKQDYWLKRQRQKEKQYRKQKQRQRQKEKIKIRRLQKQMNMQTEEQERRADKYITPDRRKIIEKQQQQDIEIIMQQNPPLPEQIPQQKKKVAHVSEQISLIKLDGQNKVSGDFLVNMPQQAQNNQQKQKQLKRNQMFNDWDKNQEVEQKPKVELHLPELHNEEEGKQQEQKIKKKIQQLQKEVPQNKKDLWQFPLDWDKLSKSVVLQRNIRPWLEKRSDQYIGGVEQKFIALVQKKLFSRSHPDKIIKILKGLLDDDSQEFVIRLWKKLVLEYLKLKNGLV